MKECLKRKQKPAAQTNYPKQDNIRSTAAPQPVTTAQPWWAPDATARTPVAAPESAPAPATEKKPAPTKMNATVLAELARIAKGQ